MFSFFLSFYTFQSFFKSGLICFVSSLNKLSVSSNKSGLIVPVDVMMSEDGVMMSEVSVMMSEVGVMTSEDCDDVRGRCDEVRGRCDDVRGAVLHWKEK